MYMVRVHHRVEEMSKSHKPEALDEDIEKAMDQQVRSALKEFVK